MMDTPEKERIPLLALLLQLVAVEVGHTMGVEQPVAALVAVPNATKLVRQVQVDKVILVVMVVDAMVILTNPLVVVEVSHRLDKTPTIKLVVMAAMVNTTATTSEIHLEKMDTLVEAGVAARGMRLPQL
jgi:hypothetical protein